MCHVSHVTCHVSPVMCHVSPVKYIFFFLQIGGASRWRVCYLVTVLTFKYFKLQSKYNFFWVCTDGYGEEYIWPGEWPAFSSRAQIKKTNKKHYTTVIRSDCVSELVRMDIEEPHTNRHGNWPRDRFSENRNIKPVRPDCKGKGNIKWSSIGLDGANEKPSQVLITINSTTENCAPVCSEYSDVRIYWNIYWQISKFFNIFIWF